MSNEKQDQSTEAVAAYLEALEVYRQVASSLKIKECKVPHNIFEGAASILDIVEGGTFVVVGIDRFDRVAEVVLTGEIVGREPCAVDVAGELHDLRRMGVVPFSYGWSGQFVTLKKELGVLKPAYERLRNDNPDAAHGLSAFIAQEFPQPVDDTTLAAMRLPKDDII